MCSPVNNKRYTFTSCEALCRADRWRRLTWTLSNTKAKIFSIAQPTNLIKRGQCEETQRMSGDKENKGKYWIEKTAVNKLIEQKVARAKEVWQHVNEMDGSWTIRGKVMTQRGNGVGEEVRVRKRRDVQKKEEILRRDSLHYKVKKKVSSKKKEKARSFHIISPDSYRISKTVWGYRKRLLGPDRITAPNFHLKYNPHIFWACRTSAAAHEHVYGSALLSHRDENYDELMDSHL